MAPAADPVILGQPRHDQPPHVLVALAWPPRPSTRRKASWALAVGLAGLGAALGVANIFTVALPYPMAKRAGSPMPQSAQGSGGHALASNLGTLACVAVAAVPVIVAGNLTSADPAEVRVPALLVCAAAYGVALAWIGVRIAARAAGGRLPELCQVAIRTKL
jgi:ABC-2 type transport system permease protein